MLAKNIAQREGVFYSSDNAMDVQYNLVAKYIQIPGMDDNLSFIKCTPFHGHEGYFYKEEISNISLFRLMDRDLLTIYKDKWDIGPAFDLNKIISSI